MKKVLFCAMIIYTGCAFALSGDDKKDGHDLDFYGVLISRQGHEEKVNAIGIGRDRDSRKMKQIPFLEKPSNAQPSGQSGEMIITQNPQKSLVVSFIDLDEIKKLEVPHPNTMWHYKPEDSAYSVEYIEVIITSKNDDLRHYLLELGRQDTKRPMKVFCSSMHKEIPIVPQNTDTDVGAIGKEHLFCRGVRISELEEKGVPFPAIKELSIDGYCHRPPNGK